MTSGIDTSKPTAGTATTASVRSNFTAAFNESNAQLRMTTDKVVTGGSANAQTASFTNPVTLAEGLRITLEIGSGLTTTSTTPELDVDGQGSKVIVNQDGSSLDIGALVAGEYVDLIYDATSPGKWVWLNSFTKEGSLIELVLETVYPVNHILTTVKTGNPGDSGYFYSGLSFGTWAAFGEGRVLIGAGTGNDGTDSVAFSSGDQGGLYNVTLTDTQIPDHYHHGVRNTGETTNGAFLQSAAQTVNHRGRIGTDREYALEAAPSNAEPNTGVSGPIVTSTGGAVTAGQSHTNVQPYITTYFWKRTA